MIAWIIYGVIALAVLAGLKLGWEGFKSHIAAPYVAAAHKEDQGKVDAAITAQKDAERDRDTARGNTGRCEATLKTQTDAANAALQVARANIAAAREAKATADKAKAAAAPLIADLQAKAAAAPKLQKCEDELAATRPVLQEALRRGRIQAPPAK